MEILTTAYDLNEVRIPPVSTALWRMETDRCLVLMHDFQEYFVNKLPEQTREALIVGAGRVQDWARANSVPCAYTGQVGVGAGTERGIIGDLWGSGMGRDAKDTGFVEELRPQKNDFVIPKWRYSAFSGNNLPLILSRLRRDQVVICGIYASVGIKATAFDCVNRDYQSFVVADAVADFDRGSHERSLEEMAAYTSRVIGANDLLKVVT